MTKPLHVTPGEARRLERNVRQSGGAPEFRPDLTDYRIYVEALAEKLNEDSVYKISMTDVLKLLIEKAMKNYCPDIVVKPKRKRYETWKF